MRPDATTRTMVGVTGLLCVLTLTGEQDTMADTESESAQPTTPVVEPSDQSEPSIAELPDLADALRAQAQDAQPQDDDGEALDDDGADADDTPASDDEAPADGEAAKDADSAKPARPNQARRLKQRVAELETEVQKHKSRAEQLLQDGSIRAAEVQSRLGSDDEYRALITKRLDVDQMLTYEEESRYAQLTNERKNAALYYQQALSGIKVGNEARVREVASKHGLDADALVPLAADAGALLTTAISATEARVRKEMSDEIDRLTADRDSARLRLAGKSPDPGMGGRSGSHAPDHLNWDTAAPGDFFAAGLRKQARQPAQGNGR